METGGTSDLIDRWNRGDGGAAEEMYRRYHSRLERFSQTLTRNEDLAEEIAADAFAEGLSALREGQRPDRFTQWMMGITRNLVLRRHRRIRREQKLVHDPSGRSGSGPATETMRREFASALPQAIEGLSPAARDVLQLYYRDKLSRDEIGLRLGIDRRALDRRFSRALGVLRTALQGHFTTCLARKRAENTPTWGGIQSLRPTFREVITLHYLEEKTISEIAAALTVPEETVHTRLKTALGQLSCTPDSDFSLARASYRTDRES